MRLFLAIFPPKEYLDYFRDSLRKFQKEKRNLKYAPVDQMHLTLKFIGPRVTQHSAQSIIETFKKYEGQYGAAELELSGIRLGFYQQSMREKKILLAKIRQTDSLTNLTKISHELIKQLKFEDTIYWKQQYAINHHITLARLKSTATHKNAKEVSKIAEGLPKPRLEPFQATEMYFVESIIQRDFSPVYKKLDKIVL